MPKIDKESGAVIYELWLIEDHPMVIQAFTTNGPLFGLHFIKVLSRLHEALGAIDTFDPTQDEIPDALLIDGNLTRGVVSNHDGKRIVEKAKEKKLLTIGNTTVGQIDADIEHQGKPGLEELYQILNNYFASNNTTSSQT